MYCNSYFVAFHLVNSDSMKWIYTFGLDDVHSLLT